MPAGSAWFSAGIVVVNDLVIGKPLKRKYLIVLWIVSTLFAAVAGAIVLEIPRYYHLTRRGVPAEALIVALQPDKHGSVIYSYQTNGHTYQGGGHAGDIGAHFEDLGVGEKVSIFFDPRAENVSCLGEPGKHLSSLLRGNAFIAFFPTLFFLVLKIRRSFGLRPPMIRTSTLSK